MQLIAINFCTALIYIYIYIYIYIFFFYNKKMFIIEAVAYTATKLC